MQTLGHNCHGGTTEWVAYPQWQGASNMSTYDVSKIGVSRQLCQALHGSNSKRSNDQDLGEQEKARDCYTLSATQRSHLQAWWIYLLSLLLTHRYRLTSHIVQTCAVQSNDDSAVRWALDWSFDWLKEFPRLPQ